MLSDSGARFGPEGIEPHEIGTVILSHGHPDHVGENLNEASANLLFPTPVT